MPYKSCQMLQQVADNTDEVGGAHLCWSWDFGSSRLPEQKFSEEEKRKKIEKQMIMK